MAELPLYQDHQTPEGPDHSAPKNANIGLWWNKFFCFYQDNFSEFEPADTRKNLEKKEGKARWLDAVSSEHENKTLTAVKNFAQRQFFLGRALGAKQNVFKTDWRFSTGLGYSHPVENGFAWHHTLGTPYLPASSIKGLLRAWMEQWEEYDDEATKQKVLLSWFGNDHKETDPDAIRAGNLIFFDAVPIEKVTLSADVMTPHMGKWYAEGDKITHTDNKREDRFNASRYPADWNSPVPVPFLTVKDTSFLFQIAARKESFEPDYDLDKAMTLLGKALEFLGAGAKTAAGYGRLSIDNDGFNDLKSIYEKTYQEQKEIEDKQRELQSLSPLEREMRELCEKKPDSNLDDEIYLLQQINHWEGENKKEVARFIQQKMQENGTWTLESKKLQKAYKRTQQVLKLLEE